MYWMSIYFPNIDIDLLSKASTFFLFLEFAIIIISFIYCIFILGLGIYKVIDIFKVFRTNLLFVESLKPERYLINKKEQDTRNFPTERIVITEVKVHKYDCGTENDNIKSFLGENPLLFFLPIHTNKSKEWFDPNKWMRDLVVGVGTAPEEVEEDILEIRVEGKNEDQIPFIQHQ
jgi:hypothetical protein